MGRSDGTTRRHILTAGALGAAGALFATPAVAAEPPFRIATEAQHKALKIVWGYPFSARAERRAGVDGYPGDVYAGHSGVDYFTSPRVGTVIHAIADGTVTEVSNPLQTADGLGQVVRVRHGSGIFSAYGHMTPGSTRVSVGQTIARGHPVGATGWSGRVVPKNAQTAHLHLAISSEPGSKPIYWNPVWLVENAPLPARISSEEDDMPFLVQSDKGHIFTVGQQYMRHETSMSDVTFLQTVYPRFVVCRTAAQFRALTNSLSIPANVPDTLRAGKGGATWAG